MCHHTDLVIEPNFLVHLSKPFPFFHQSEHMISFILSFSSFRNRDPIFCIDGLVWYERSIDVGLCHFVFIQGFGQPEGTGGRERPVGVMVVDGNMDFGFLLFSPVGLLIGFNDVIPDGSGGFGGNTAVCPHHPGAAQGIHLGKADDHNHRKDQ